MTSYFLQTRLQASFPQIFREARKLGLTTSFDPNSDPTHTWSNSIREVFANTDLLFVNKAEALALTRTRTVSAALKALGQQVPCAVVKLGPDGAMAIKDDQITSAIGFPIDPIDTTGAGDSFAAGFVSSYLRGRPMSKCLGVANACGALSALQVGGTRGQPTQQTLKKFLSAYGPLTEQ